MVLFFIVVKLKNVTSARTMQTGTGTREEFYLYFVVQEVVHDKYCVSAARNVRPKQEGRDQRLWKPRSVHRKLLCFSKFVKQIE